MRAGGSGVTISKLYDISEIPVFVRSGAMLPTTTLQLGSTVGNAQRAYRELEFTVFNPTKLGGKSSVYEDDGNTTAYATDGVAAYTHASYTVSEAGALEFSVASQGLEGANLESAGVPATRLYTLKLVNANPPASVEVAGTKLPFSRYTPHPRGTWHYDGDEMTLVVNAASVSTSDSVKITVNGAMPTSAISSGIKGQMRHSILAKANLDETRKTPGAHTPVAGGSLIDQAASTAESFSFLAGNDVDAFAVRCRYCPPLAFYPTLASCCTVSCSRVPCLGCCAHSAYIRVCVHNVPK